jgi:hypothetical protein
MFCNKLEVLWCGIVSLPPYLQAGGPASVSCLRLLVQYIRRYPPYLEAISCICNLRMYHAMVTADPLNVALNIINKKNEFREQTWNFVIVK